MAVAMQQEPAGLALHEHVVLHKFEGDDQTRPALETIVIDDGVLLSLCEHAWESLPDAPGFESDKVCPRCGEEWTYGTN